jgi:DNA-binding HxlR family transcriptional regulator
MKLEMPSSKCSISYSLDLFGDRWTLLIMRDLLFYEKKCFIDFLGSAEKIATNILSNRLNHLVKEGFVTKKVSPANKSKFLYYPTRKGIDLIPVLCELSLWAETYNPLGAPKELLTALRSNKTRTIKSLKKRFENQLAKTK